MKIDHNEFYKSLRCATWCKIYSLRQMKEKSEKNKEQIWQIKENKWKIKEHKRTEKKSKKGVFRRVVVICYRWVIISLQDVTLMYVSKGKLKLLDILHTNFKTRIKSASYANDATAHRQEKSCWFIVLCKMLHKIDSLIRCTLSKLHFILSELFFIISCQ